MRIVCLASGGLDSSVLLWKTWKRGHVVVPLFIDYGQRAAAQEHRAASRICGKIGIKLERIDIPGLSDIDNGLSDPVHDAGHVFHARNMILLSVAASLAASRSIRAIGIGIHGTAAFPDQTGAFVRSAGEGPIPGDGRQDGAVCAVHQIRQGGYRQTGHGRGGPDRHDVFVLHGTAYPVAGGVQAARTGSVPSTRWFKMLKRGGRGRNPMGGGGSSYDPGSYRKDPAKSFEKKIKSAETKAGGGRRTGRQGLEADRDL